MRGRITIPQAMKILRCEPEFLFHLVVTKKLKRIRLKKQSLLNQGYKYGFEIEQVEEIARELSPRKLSA